MDILLLPLTVMAFLFAVMPWLAVLPAALFFWWYFRLRSKSCLVAAVCWIVYFPYEMAMYLRVLCTGECNIRLDLFLIYPLLLVVSLTGIAAWLRERSRRRGQDTSS